MVAHFLQWLSPPALPIVPLVRETSAEDEKAISIEYWEESAYDSFSSNCTESLGHLLYKYFTYYATKFDCSRHVVSLRHIELIELTIPEMRAKFQETHRTCFCVEDPVDETDNIGRNILPEAAEYITSEFQRAYNLIRRGDSFAKICEPPRSVPQFHGPTVYPGSRPSFGRGAPAHPAYSPGTAFTRPSF